MKKVTRYKCDFCQKIAARPETIQKHEEVCLKNPAGKNCYMCELAYLGDYEYDDGYVDSQIRTIKDQCICAYSEEVISSVLGAAEGNLAPKCGMFHRAEDGYWYRDSEMAEKNLEKYEKDGYAGE